MQWSPILCGICSTGKTDQSFEEDTPLLVDYKLLIMSPIVYIATAGLEVQGYVTNYLHALVVFFILIQNSNK